MTDAQMPTEAHDINSKLAQLQEAQKGRLNEIAQADPVWAHLAGQIEALVLRIRSCSFCRADV